MNRRPPFMANKMWKYAAQARESQRRVMKEVMTFRGDRRLWIDFVAEVKKERKEVWEVLSELISDYLKNKKIKE